MAQEAPEDPFTGLAENEQLAKDWDMAAFELFDPTPEPTAEALMQDALEAEAAAMAVSGVSQVSDAAAGFGTHRVHLAATNGFSGGSVALPENLFRATSLLFADRGARTSSSQRLAWPRLAVHQPSMPMPRKSLSATSFLLIT